MRATKFFVEPECQSVDPSGGEDFRKVYSAREPAFQALDKLFASGAEEKYTFVLGDSGMGKTTLLLNYYARHCRKRRPPFTLALVPLGSGYADRAIESLRNRPDTVLLLDAFDEDTLAMKDHRKRLFAILDHTRDFQHVLFTSRTQFFARDDEIPRETGIVRIGLTSAGQDKAFTFNKLYLSPFSSKKVKSYLRLSFPVWKILERRRAAAISTKIPDLTVRPMLLAHIKDLLRSKTQYQFSAQIYESMIEAWLKRERAYVDSTSLRTFSENLAVDIYTKRGIRGQRRSRPTKQFSWRTNRQLS